MPRRRDYDDDYDDDIDAATLIREESRTGARPAAPPLPSGSQIQPAQPRLPPPHIPTTPVTPAIEPTSTGGPHFITPPPQREEIKESGEGAAKNKPPRGDFGAGIF